MFSRKFSKFISLYSREKKINRQTIIDRNFFENKQDAKLFIDEFASKFNVNITNFDFNKYFNDTEVHPEKNYLTVGDLNKAKSVGILDDYIIHSEEFESKFSPDLTTKNIVVGIIIVIVATIFLCLVSVYS